jgi:hypothetical protein
MNGPFKKLKGKERIPLFRTVGNKAKATYSRKSLKLSMTVPANRSWRVEG